MIKYLFIVAFLIMPLSACNQEEVDAKNMLSLVSIDDGTEHKFIVELAITPKEQEIGLMNRKKLKKNAGMLFWFGGEEAERSFWMKNTLIPLDLLFIKADGTIYDIHENSIPNDLTSMKSYGDVAAVLEVNAGLTAKLGIWPDDKVVHPFFTENSQQ